jgi:CrcB protein
MAYLWIALGSALGGMARHGVVTFVASRWEERFPFGTLAVNVLGSLAIGAIAAWLIPSGKAQPHALQPLLMIGFLGGFTTFSSFSLQTLNLLNGGKPVTAMVYIGASLLLCLVAVWLGHAGMKTALR